jgi:dolichol-phosphate mannosyltransferase
LSTDGAASILAGVDLSVIVPAMNEAENLPTLVERIAAAVGTMKGGGISYEIIIVDDDSQDGTERVCSELAGKYPVKLIIRKVPLNGLSGAVLHGMAQATGKYLVVMDADLQHPAEKLPALLEPLEKGEADFVLGSRYVAGGSTEADWSLFRQINSGVATFLARPFAGRVTDPMSGFFALERTSYENARRLTPVGYKIGLELMCKCRVRRVVEIPIHFSHRLHGESKLSIKQQFRYLEHLSRLYDFSFPRASPVIKFLVVTGLGWLAGLAAYLVMRQNHVGPVAGPVLAYIPAIGVTSIFHARYVARQREFIVRPRPWLDFVVISVAEWMTCLLAAWWVCRRVNHPTHLETFILSFGAATAMRYVLRKEFMQDIRGLRREIRLEEMD